MNRKWLPSLADLIDRLSIHQLKEVLIPSNKDVYAREMNEISHDIDMIAKEKNVEFSSDLLRAVIILSQINTHIWYNESKVRKGESQDLNLLKLTHGLNGIRNKCMNYIKFHCNESDRLDLKIDCLAAEFEDWKYSFLEQKSRE
tara:strand:- start:243 stop:674 length:432 start_codon:yes stop_codon:yes gene_type:complete